MIDDPGQLRGARAYLGNGPWRGWPAFAPDVATARSDALLPAFMAYMDGTPVYHRGAPHRIVWHDYGEYDGRTVSFMGLRPIAATNDKRPSLLR